MFRKDKDNILISLDEAAVKIIRISSGGGVKKIINAVKRDIREVPEQELPEVIRTAVGEMNIKKAPAICTIPPSQLITKNIEIPSLDPEEIRSIIDLQAGRHTPFSREEILVGYITIGVFQRNYTKILLILVNRNVVKKQLAVFEEAGVKVEKVLFAPEGMACFYSDALKVSAEDIPFGIIDISGQSTGFVVAYNKTVAMYRNIPMGMSQLLKEGVDGQARWVNELQQSVEAYQNEDINRLPENYFLTSDDAAVKDLQPALQEKLRANVKIMPYLDMVKASQPLMVKLVSEYNDDSFLHLIGSGCCLSRTQVDLTPDEIKTQRAIEEKSRLIIQTGIYIIVSLILLIFIFVTKEHFKNAYLERLKQDYREKRKKVMALDRIAQKTRIVKGYLQSRMVGLEVFTTLYSLVPDEIYLQSVSLEENGSVEVAGVSESMSRVFNFVTALEESDLFKNVKTRSTTAKKDRGKDVAAFEIGMKLEWASEDDAVPTADEVMGTDEPEKQ